MIYIFLLNLIIIVKKKKNCPTHRFNPTQPNPCGLDWIGLGWTYVMGWVGLNFFNPPWWVVSKNPLNSTQPDPCTLLYKKFSTKLIVLSFFHKIFGQSLATKLVVT